MSIKIRGRLGSLHIIPFASNWSMITWNVWKYFNHSCECVQVCMVPHLHLSSLIFFKHKAELLWIRSCYQPQQKRMITQRKLLEQICRVKKGKHWIPRYITTLQKHLWRRCPAPTLSIAVRLSVQCKLAGIVQHHELLQQALDDFSGGGMRADVELLHAVWRQVKGCSLVTRLNFRRLRSVQFLRGRGDHVGDSDWSTEP